MPRIRTIKPEFFTDSKTGTLSALAAKVFIGLWCHADDYGGPCRSTCWSSRRKILPYEQSDHIETVWHALVTELLPKGLAVYFVVLADPAKTRRGLDEGFLQHARTSGSNLPCANQRVDKPSQRSLTAGRLRRRRSTGRTHKIIPAGPPSDGLPEFDPDPESRVVRGGLGRTPGALGEGFRTGKERKGEERKGKERRGVHRPPRTDPRR